MKYLLKPDDKLIYYLLVFAYVLDFLQYIIGPANNIAYLLKFAIFIFMLPYYYKAEVKNQVFYIIFFYFIFLILLGIFRGNFYKYLIFDISIYSSLAFLLYFNKSSRNNQNSDKIPRLFAQILFLSIPFLFLMLLLFGDINFHDSLARTLLRSDKGEMDDKIFLAPIAIAPLLVPFIKNFSPKLKYVVLTANSLFLLYGIVTATRSFIIIPIISFLSLVKYDTKIRFSRFFYIITVIVFLFLISITNKRIQNFIEKRVDYAILRFEKKHDFASGRQTEAKDLFKEFSFIEFVIGRGAGAEQKFGFWKKLPSVGNHGINFTHFGFLHLILKGGFILLILVYGLAIYSMIILFRYGEQRYFFVLLIYLIYELSHTQFVNYFYVLFLWLSISYALNLKRNRGLTPGQIESYD
jgi:hypothetical protein